MVPNFKNFQSNGFSGETLKLCLNFYAMLKWWETGPRTIMDKIIIVVCMFTSKLK